MGRTARPEMQYCAIALSVVVIALLIAAILPDGIFAAAHPVNGARTNPLIYAGDSPEGMEGIRIPLTEKEAEGFVVPLGPANLVFAKTDIGLVGCGAFDVAALERFGYPAARVRPAEGSSIRDLDDLLAGIIAVANEPAAKRSIAPGMTGREALELL